MKNKINSIHIVGKRWFQTTYGNTYHSCTVYIDGKETLYKPFSYGYGNQFLVTAFDMLKASGYISENMDYFEFMDFFHSINGTYTDYDVKRKRDL